MQAGLVTNDWGIMNGLWGELPAGGYCVRDNCQWNFGTDGGCVCDGTAEDGIGSTWYADTDPDGYGGPDGTLEDCDQPSGYVTDDMDCHATDILACTGAAAVCDGSGNDCGGTIDSDAFVDGFTSPADTCLDVLTERTTAADGLYWVDVDGAGDVVESWCEMDVGGCGWMVVFNP